MKAALQEGTLRHRDVTQLASEPAHLPVTDQRPRGQGSRAHAGLRGSQPPWGVRRWFTSQAPQFRQPGPPFTGCVTVGELLSPSVPQFSHLENEDNS